MDKEQWIQPSTPAKFTQSGWVRLYPEPKPVTDKKLSCMLVLSVVSITLASVLVVLGYFVR